MNKKQITVVPGPGSANPNDSYLSRYNTTMSCKFQTEDRIKEPAIVRKQPGPFEYKIPSRIGESQQYQFGLRPYIDPLKMRTGTGPGDYNPKGLFRVQSGHIGARPKDLDFDTL